MVRLIVLLLLFAAPLLPAQPPREAIAFRVTSVERDKKTGKFRVAWQFENRDSASVTFDYRLTTNTEETVSGRMTLQVAKQRTGGWLFAGERITGVTITPAH
jgi:hypothetical protein